ncbi:MAG: SDR family oxidoreductase [Spirochaetaceae bacterium]|nr:SDR family oxidoreductase [Spirochaetaceae bacterium]
MGIFAQKKAVVIGGSGGIGAKLSLKLAQEGASVLVHGGHNSQKLSDLMQTLETHAPQSARHKSLVQEITGDNLAAFPASPLMEHVKEADILCVAFGPFLQGSLEETTPKQWMDITLLNYTLPGICVSAALPYMKEKRWGRILLFGGTLTHNVKAYRTNAAYGGAKTALCSLVKSTAAQYSSWGITCNGILPGLTETEYQSPQLLSMLAQKNPSGKIIPAETIATAAINLLLVQEINGALLNVDDGWTP